MVLSLFSRGSHWLKVAGPSTTAASKPAQILKQAAPPLLKQAALAER